MKKLDNNCLLVDEHHHLAMIFGTYNESWSMTVNNRIMASMNFILHQFESDSRTFKVIKNRWGYLHEITPILDTALDEYTVLDDGWHGMIKISDSDYFRIILSLG